MNVGNSSFNLELNFPSLAPSSGFTLSPQLMAKVASLRTQLLAMPFLRSSNPLKLWRTYGAVQRSVVLPSRSIYQSPACHLQEPDPLAIPSDLIQSTEDQASLVTVDQAAESVPTTYRPSHQPDYNAHVDYGTSYVRVLHGVSMHEF